MIRIVRLSELEARFPPPKRVLFKPSQAPPWPEPEILDPEDGIITVYLRLANGECRTARYEAGGTVIRFRYAVWAATGIPWARDEERQHVCRRADDNLEYNLRVNPSAYIDTLISSGEVLQVREVRRETHNDARLLTLAVECGAPPGTFTQYLEDEVPTTHWQSKRSLVNVALKSNAIRVLIGVGIDLSTNEGRDVMPGYRLYRCPHSHGTSDCPTHLDALLEGGVTFDMMGWLPGWSAIDREHRALPNACVLMRMLEHGMVSNGLAMWCNMINLNEMDRLENENAIDDFIDYVTVTHLVDRNPGMLKHEIFRILIKLVDANRSEGRIRKFITLLNELDAFEPQEETIAVF